MSSNSLSNQTVVYRCFAGHAVTRHFDVFDCPPRRIACPPPCGRPMKPDHGPRVQINSIEIISRKLAQGLAGGTR